MRTETVMGTERIGHAGQRFAKVFGHHLLLRHVVRHFTQSVHIVRKSKQLCRDIRYSFKGAAHHGRAHNLAKGADMRQAGRPVTGFEQYVALVRRVTASTLQDLARLLEGPGLGLHREVVCVSHDVFFVAVLSRAGTLCRPSRSVNRDGRLRPSNMDSIWRFLRELSYPTRPHLPSACRRRLGSIRPVRSRNSRLRTRTFKEGVRPLLCHGPGTAGRLSLKRFQCFDVLELFAFVRPLDFCVPTPRGLGTLWGSMWSPSGGCRAGLVQATQALLNELADTDQVDARPVAWAMARGGWSWGHRSWPRSEKKRVRSPRSPAAGLDVWRAFRNGLSTRRHRRPRLMRSSRTRRAGVLRSCSTAVRRHGRARPTMHQLQQAFRPRDREGEPNFILAEAGTGVGKTWLSHRQAWAEKNEAPVWLSTYTRNLSTRSIRNSTASIRTLP